MSQGWQLLSLDSRLRLKLAREELALSLPPNPEDAPLLLTPQPRNHASHHFLVFSRLIRGIPSVIFLVLGACKHKWQDANVFFFVGRMDWNWRKDGNRIFD